ncbi:MAG: hypothetical protein HOE90_10530 [Bacteriovoracaceae bacterium]|jgi:hypothetical protein|nr:hypothetical protein [Bacteriovoracaceae bacterium]
MSSHKNNPFEHPDLPENLRPDHSLLRDNETRQTPDQVLEDINSYIEDNSDKKEGLGNSKLSTIIVTGIYALFMFPIAIFVFKGNYLLTIPLSILVCALAVVYFKSTFDQKIQSARKRKEDLNLDKYEKRKSLTLIKTDMDETHDESVPYKKAA